MPNSMSEDKTLKDTMESIEAQIRQAKTRLKSIREDLGMTQKDFAEKFGVDESTYSRYESKKLGAIKSMPHLLIAHISIEYGLNPAWLMGYPKVEKYINFEEINQKTKKVPVLGSIAAGIPILAQEELMGYEAIAENEHLDFCLKVKGDSMVGARIFDGDTVFIRMQSDIEHGEIAAVIVGGEEATLKRIFKAPNTIILHSENPAYGDQVLTGKEVKQVNIIGKAVYFKSEVK